MARVYIDEDRLAFAASAFTLIHPYACYAGVHMLRLNLCAKTVRKTCMFVFIHSATSPFFNFLCRIGY